MSIGQIIAHGCPPWSVILFGLALASRRGRTCQGIISLVQDSRHFVDSFSFEQVVIVRVMFIFPFGAGFRYGGWHRVTVGIYAAIICSAAASSTLLLNTSGLFLRVAELPMLGFLGGGEACVHKAITVLGFDMGLGINLFLRWLAGAMVIPALSAASTITAPPARSTSSNRRDASPGWVRFVIGGCGPLESYVMVFHLVKSGELAKAC